MRMKYWLHLAAAALGFVVLLAAWPTLRPQAQPVQPVAVQGDTDDIGGVVTSQQGPEAGVWVIAQTTELGTRFAKSVVTDDRGRYVIPDLTPATYQVWVRATG
jgi:carboxypeptidase family protein